MRAIIVDDEPIMLKSFMRLSKDITDLEVVGEFKSADDAVAFVKENPVELAFLDVKMPGTNGIELAEKIRSIQPDVLLVFISAHDEYIRDFNRIGGDYYVVKPYKAQTLETVMEKIRLLAKGQDKRIYIKTFGRFMVLKDGSPVMLRGKAKEILALIVTKRGGEISNEEIYRTIWENRAYSNYNMTVYYNALRRLKKTLEEESISDLLISSAGGQMINTAVCDCDYYRWLDGEQDLFKGEFLSEYTWGELILAEMPYC